MSEFDPEVAAEAQDAIEAVLTQLSDDGTVSFPTQSTSNDIWMLVAGFLVFFMHCGFAMLEAGSVQKGSVINIMFKNVGTIAIGGVLYWLLGFAFAYGTASGSTNGFIGVDGEAFAFNYEYAGGVSALFFFQFTFAATAATIVSGAVAERVALGGYFIVAAFMTAFIFPVVTHWVWSSVGFMSAFAPEGNLVEGSIGLIDFAGSGVVHMTGGVAALVGAKIIGPRKGRFIEGKPMQLGPSSYTLQTLGTFILWFGWYGFNCGSTLVFDGTNMAKAALTTTLAPSAAGVVGVISSRVIYGRYDLPTVLNCILAGLVGITAGCTAVADWASILIGGIAAIVYIAGAKLLEKFQIDDPIGAAPVHGLAGLWGVIAVGIFLDADAIADSHSAEGVDQGAQFGMQVVGPIIIALWSGATSFVLFYALKATNMLRISDEDEVKGIDESEHGGAQQLHF